MNDIYLTEQSLKALLEKKKIYNDNDIIHPPKTNELDLTNKDKITRRNKQILYLKKKLQKYMYALSYERAMANDHSIMEEPEV